MQKSDKIFVAGHKGLVGKALVSALKDEGFTNLILRTRSQLDLTNQSQVNHFFAKERPEYVFLAAAKVGGIHVNNIYRGDFIYQNLMIQTNVLEAAKRYDVKRLLFLGSSCIYPRDCPQPMREDYLLTSPLEKTNEPYAIAKIAGIKMCESYNSQYNTNFVTVMPTNLYGPHDNFDLNTSHVLPALLRKFHEAKIACRADVVIWGTGKPKREFLHVNDLALACLFVMKKTTVNDMVNIGSGIEVSIQQLAQMIAEVVGFHGEIIFDPSMPDGTPRKLLDCSRLNNLGWHATISLDEGIRQTYDWFVNHYSMSTKPVEVFSDH